MIVNILQISVCVYIYISNEERPGPFVLVIQSCPTLCDPMDYSSPGSSVHRLFQARILEWFAMPSSRGSSWPRDRTHISCLLHWQTSFFYH